jgi:hypothetical protein
MADQPMKTVKYLNAPCDDCPFLKKGGIRLRRARIQEILGVISDFSSGGEFSCHKTTKHNDEGEAAPSHVHCGGALIFMEKQDWSSAMSRLAGRIGLYRPEKVTNAAKKKVFDSVEQMLKTAVDKKKKHSSGTGEPCSGQPVCAECSTKQVCRDCLESEGTARAS